MVEIKFTFTGEEELQQAQDLGWLAASPAARTVVFFDTAECGLLDGTLLDSQVRLILRARFNPKKNRWSTTLKVRTAGTLDESLRTDDGANAKREVDFAFGRQPLDSYSLDCNQERVEIEEVLAARRPVKSIFNDAQEACIDKVVNERFPWADLRIFGPVERVKVWEEASIAGLSRAVTFELWSLPAMGPHPARRILELSTRALNDERDAVVDKILQVLSDNDINPSASDTKTKMVLEHFAPGGKTK